MAKIMQSLILLCATTIYGSAALECYSCQTWSNGAGNAAGVAVWAFLESQPGNADCRAGVKNATDTGCDDCMYQDVSITITLVGGSTTSVDLYQRGCIKDIPNYSQTQVPKNQCLDGGSYPDDVATKFGELALLSIFQGGATSAKFSGVACQCRTGDKCNSGEPVLAGGSGVTKASPLLLSVMILAIMKMMFSR